MKLRIALWSGVGALVVVLWSIYISATLSNPLGSGGIGRALVYLTCPIAVGSRHPQGLKPRMLVN